MDGGTAAWVCPPEVGGLVLSDVEFSRSEVDLVPSAFSTSVSQESLRIRTLTSGAMVRCWWPLADDRCRTAGEYEYEYEVGGTATRTAYAYRRPCRDFPGRQWARSSS